MQVSELEPVSQRYQHYLRLVIARILLLALAAVAAATFWIPEFAVNYGISLAVIIILLGLLLMFGWVPRRYKVTGYLLETGQLRFRVGALWLTDTAVPINRIQHVEVSQGPMERWLGISRLLVFTAGGSGSDLIIPGLADDVAEQLRSNLVQRVPTLQGEHDD